MIMNIWDQVQIYCACHGKDSVKMTPHDGPHSMFYACPKYYPENRTDTEIACANRLNLVEFEEAVSRVSKEIEGDGSEFFVINLEGMRWKNKKSTEFRVIRHDHSGIHVSVKNVRALR